MTSQYPGGDIYNLIPSRVATMTLCVGWQILPHADGADKYITQLLKNLLRSIHPVVSQVLQVNTIIRGSDFFREAFVEP